jgi:hypothetical protein
VRHLAWALSSAIRSWLRASAWIYRPRGGYFFLYRDLDRVRRVHHWLTDVAVTKPE